LPALEQGGKIPGSGTRVLVDRDVNAARNIVERGLRFGPVGVSGEAVMAEDPAESMPLSQVR